MTATSEQIAIGSAAAVMAGDNPISDFSGTAPGILLANIYESVVRGELGERKYKWATKYQQLSREADVPPTLWDASYAMPSDVIEFYGLLDGPTGKPLDYDIFETHVFCNADVNDVVVGKYVYRVDETHWRPQFRLGMILSLAGYIVLSVQEDEQKAQRLWQRAEERFVRAGFKSASSATSQKPARKGRITSARYGR